MNVWSMLSNAFLKSINKMSEACLFLFTRLRIQDPMLFEVIYAFCCFPMRSSTTGFILIVIQQLASLWVYNSLPTTDFCRLSLVV